ncbi:type II toxin-antitoxin system RelE/ParE family toxin [Enterobacteriaceae bacterium]
MSFMLAVMGCARKELMKLPVGLQAALIDAMSDLERAGPALREPHVRDMGHGLKELRITAPEGIARGFFFFHLRQQIVVVHFLHKKTQKTPVASLRLARERMKQLKRMQE